MLDLAWGLMFLSPVQGKTKALQVRFDSEQLCISFAHSRNENRLSTSQAVMLKTRLLHCTTEDIKGYKGIINASHALA